MMLWYGGNSGDCSQGQDANRRVSDWCLGPIGFATQNSISDTLRSFGDPAPQLSLKWNEGVNSFMVYSRGGIPVGDYNPDRNLGKGHGALDNGFGYTYFNEGTGFEFSAVSALTYNFRNPQTDYQNGIDWHTDLEASQFLYKRELQRPKDFAKASRFCGRT